MQIRSVGNINWIFCNLYGILINTICKLLVADRIKSRAEAAENCSGGIVEKIRCDVKGLRNAFSKGRRGTR